MVPLADADARWMRRALALAERGRATVSPNPMVGCVLVRNGEVVGEGFHGRPGGPHAEVAALTAAGARARGATAYVTLEPCNHEGRTGPCVRALVQAGVARVVAALDDPNPAAAGGADALRAAGIPVDLGVCHAQAARQNEVFLHGLRQQRPFVVLKSAVSLDGRVAAADGTSQWLTGEDARRHAHRLRAEVDAVLVGSGTVLADDPHLTVRLPDGERRQPLRVVLDARGRLPAGAAVLDGAAGTVVFTSADVALDGAEVVVVERAPDRGLRLDAVLAALWERNVRSVLVEGGATVGSAFLTAGLVDRLVLHIAPLLLGASGQALLHADVPTLTDAERWTLAAVERAGQDALLTLYPKRGA